MVCTHLKPTEVANLRLASRAVAPIGLQYLVPEVHLLVAEDSFKQLETIAGHPVASKYVTSLFYEADVLDVFDEEEWELFVRSPDYYDRVQILWEAPRPRYMLRSYKGELAQTRTVPRHFYTQQQLHEAFRKYQEFCDYQGRVNQLDRKVATAMKNLPNLKELTVSAGVWPLTQVFHKSFAPGYCTIIRKDVEEWPTGLVQMRSLLLGACHADLKIERLRCKGVSWRILARKKKTFEDMKRSLRHLRVLSISFSAGNREEVDRWGFLPTRFCAEYLQNGRLKEFVTSAPDLERLEICFPWSEHVDAVNLRHVVGDFYWPSLKAVKFETIDTTEDELVGYFERHASTIKDLRIGSIFLNGGSWWSVFQRIHLVLRLDTVEILDSLQSDLGMLDFEAGSEDEQFELREGIESYLLHDLTDQKTSLSQFLIDFWGDGPDSLFWNLPAVKP